MHLSLEGFNLQANHLHGLPVVFVKVFSFPHLFSNRLPVFVIHCNRDGRRRNCENSSDSGRPTELETCSKNVTPSSSNIIKNKTRTFQSELAEISGSYVRESRLGASPTSAEPITSTTFHDTSNSWKYSHIIFENMTYFAEILC